MSQQDKIETRKIKNGLVSWAKSYIETMEKQLTNPSQQEIGTGTEVATLRGGNRTAPADTQSQQEVSPECRDAGRQVNKDGDNILPSDTTTRTYPADTLKGCGKEFEINDGWKLYGREKMNIVCGTNYFNQQILLCPDCQATQEQKA